MNTPTPETEAEFDRLRFVVEPMSEFGMTQRDEVVFGMRDFARKLERERDEARNRIIALELESQAIGDATNEIQRERDQLRKVCDELRRLNRDHKPHCALACAPNKLCDCGMDAVIDSYNQPPHVKK